MGREGGERGSDCGERACGRRGRTKGREHKGNATIPRKQITQPQCIHSYAQLPGPAGARAASDSDRIENSGSCSCLPLLLSCSFSPSLSHSLPLFLQPFISVSLSLTRPPLSQSPSSSLPLPHPSHPNVVAERVRRARLAPTHSTGAEGSWKGPTGRQDG